MAVPAQSSGLWVVVWLATVSLVSSADCGKECALCVYHLLGQQSALPPLACSLECDGALDTQKLRLCREMLLEEDTQLEDNQQELEETADNMAAKEDDDTTPEHLLAKKYGGFMKRYGGFMARRSSSTPEGGLEEMASNDGQENVRMEILKILNAATERGENAGDAIKRYGGFMRRAGSDAQSDVIEAMLGRGLKKRYGGFMRRVGRPEWLVENAKGNGIYKRAWESGSELQKRYGGFMD